MNGTYLKIFTDFAVTLEPLSEAEIGRLFMAMLKYAETSELPDLRGNERIIWPTAKLHIDRERAFCEKQRSNRTKPDQTQPNTTKPDQTHQKDKDKDKDKDIIPPYSPPKGDGERFERFWNTYPRKVGKDAARKAFSNRKVTEKLLDQMLAAIEQQKRSDQWTRDGGQFIPHPATWLNQGRWQDEMAISRQKYQQHQLSDDELNKLMNDLGGAL